MGERTANRERVLNLALSACQTLLGPRGCQSEEGEQWGETCEDARFRATTPAPSTHRILQRMCVPHRMRQYPNANSEDVREERDSEEGCNSRGEDGWCEPRGLPWELRETIKKHSKTTTSDARRPLRRKFLLRRPVFGRAYRANVLQVNIFINLQFGRPADVFRFVCCAPCMPAGASLNRHDPRTHTPPPHAHLARLVCPTERQITNDIALATF